MSPLVFGAYAAEWAAFFAALEQGDLGGHVYDAVRFNGADAVRDNYVVVYASTPRRLDDERFTALQTPESTALYRGDVRSVATTAAGALLLADEARSNLIGQVLAVGDRACDPIRHVPNLEEGVVVFDRAANLFHVTESFEFISRRA